MEGFSLDTTVFTEQELTAIFTGLKSIDSVSKTASAEKLAQKIGGDSAIRLADNMIIDLSSFYKNDLTSKIGTIKEAIKSVRI
jgi:predicted DNA-binding transcriptional regulator YafY